MPDSISPFDRPLTHISVFHIVYFSLIPLRTPTSYLEMLQTFKELLTMKKTEVLEAKERYEIGLFSFKINKYIISFYFTINYY